MSQKKRPSWLSRLFDSGLVALFLSSGWISFRRASPDASFADYLTGIVTSSVWVFPVLALVLAAIMIDRLLRRLGPEKMRKHLPLMIGGLCLSVAMAAVLIWMQSGWAALPLGLAIFLGVQAARAAGLESPADSAVPYNQGR